MSDSSAREARLDLLASEMRELFEKLGAGIEMTQSGWLMAASTLEELRRFVRRPSRGLRRHRRRVKAAERRSA